VGQPGAKAAQSRKPQQLIIRIKQFFGYRDGLHVDVVASDR